MYDRADIRRFLSSSVILLGVAALGGTACSEKAGQRSVRDAEQAMGPAQGSAGILTWLVTPTLAGGAPGGSPPVRTRSGQDPLPSPEGTGGVPGERTAEPPKARIEQKDKTRRDYGQRDCLSSGCHAELRATPRVHGPVAVGSCDTCHQAAGDVKDHRFEPTRPPELLCTFCHPPAEALPVTHKPFAESKCVGCHDPHGGEDNKFLLAGKIREVCKTCHEQDQLEFQHKPVSEGDCLACHAAHQSKHDRLLVRDQGVLCLDCHREYNQIAEKFSHVHEPVLADGCARCHQSHSSVVRGLLRQEPRVLCVECHEDVGKGLANAQSRHGTVNREQCVGCHEPHAGEIEHLLLGAPGQLCSRCHDREITLPDGRTIANVQEQITSGVSVHEPVEKGDCAHCHVAHSSPHIALLRSEYPKKFYAEFSESLYGLCLDCHDKRMVLEERSTITQFRDGDRNLHYLHVNRKKGRVCWVCHDAHASSAPRQMRETVSFGPGQWELPIRFRQTESGGSCSTGCHKELTYDNTNPPAAPER